MTLPMDPRLQLAATIGAVLLALAVLAALFARLFPATAARLVARAEGFLKALGLLLLAILAAAVITVAFAWLTTG